MASKSSATENRMNGETRLAFTARTRLRRFPVRGKFDRQTIYAILDPSRCTVGASLEAEWRPHTSRWVPQGLACWNESVDEHFRPTGICDGLAEGFRTIAVRDCIGDRVPGAVAWNLLDIDAKFADMAAVDTCVDHRSACRRLSPAPARRHA
jgi:hypothetical protein